MKRLIVLALLVAVAALSACRETPSGFVVGTGTVHPSAYECIAWFVHSDSGREYQLTSLPPQFQQRQLRVRFTLRTRTDIASTCMVGEIADVVAMEKF